MADLTKLPGDSLYVESSGINGFPRSRDHYAHLTSDKGHVWNLSMNYNEFAVSRFKNRNGAISWRVAGFLHGIRIRKNFKTREEASAEKASLDIKALQASSGLRPIMDPLALVLEGDSFALEFPHRLPVRKAVDDPSFHIRSSCALLSAILRQSSAVGKPSAGQRHF